jgi:cytidylate kinase
MAGLLVITGPPGAGKSTVAARVAEQRSPSVLIEGDAFFAFLAQGAVAPWLPEAHGQNEVVVRAAAAAAGCFAAEYAVVYDGVVGPWFLDTFAAATGRERLHYVVLLPPVEQCVRRVHAREDHGFRDEAATRKMHEEFSRAVVEERHLLRNPPDDPDAVARELVARVEDGSIAYEA